MSDQAQAGQLWRDLRPSDSHSHLQDGDRRITRHYFYGAPSHGDSIVWQRPVPGPANCDGLRTALETLMFGTPSACRKSEGKLHQPGICGYCDGIKALAASRPCQQSGRSNQKEWDTFGPNISIPPQSGEQPENLSGDDARPAPIPGKWLATQSENPAYPNEWDVKEGGRSGYSVIGEGFITEGQAKEIELRHNLTIPSDPPAAAKSLASKEWFVKSAQIEGDSEVGAGFEFPA